MSFQWGLDPFWRVSVRKRLYGATPELAFLLDRTHAVDFTLLWWYRLDRVRGVPEVRTWGYCNRTEHAIPLYRCECCKTMFVGSTLSDLDHTCTETL